jgi:hypothetical protein
VILTGTSQATEPVVTFNDGRTSTGVVVSNPNILNNVSEFGNSALAFGEMTIEPSQQGSITISNGIDLSYGNLAMGAEDGGTTNIVGASVVTNESTFTTMGGRYEADPTVLKGAMIVANGSTAKFNNAPLHGNGTVYVEGSSTVEAFRVVAGFHMDVLNGGKLVLGGFGPSSSPSMSF